MDHFEPKSIDPEMAYEWKNFRLAQKRINSNKGDSKEVLDPFHIQEGWFILDFDSFYVKPNFGLRTEVERNVLNTIEILKLNSDTFVHLRKTVLSEYSTGDFTMNFLERRYPFLALELKRQGLVESFKGKIRN